MHPVSAKDGDRVVDWGKTSRDYAAFRPGYPDSFWRRLEALGVGVAGQRVLDLGTGTGAIARPLARRGCRVTGIDVAAGQVEEARRLAREEGLEIDFRRAPAEETDLPGAGFDLVTASQCWLYFDGSRAIAEVKRLLAPGGLLLTCHLCWMPRLDPVVRGMEALVLRHNPDWSAADYSGDVPAMPEWARDDFDLAAMFVYDEPIPFTHEAWRGRVRACRGIGATLSPEEIARFDEDHRRLLERIAPDPFEALHRIDAHLLRPKG